MSPQERVKEVCFEVMNERVINRLGTQRDTGG
jgi:hypothetical protein